MSNSKSETRIKEICNILNNRQNKIYSINAIIEILKTRGFERISRRTIQSDLATLRDNGAKINTSAGMGNLVFNFTEPFTYQLVGFLSGEESEAIKKVRVLMEQYANIEEFNVMRQAVNKILSIVDEERVPYVQPELKSLQKGFKYFNALYEAIKNKKLVELAYMPNYQAKSKTYNIEPLFLKESMGMWYCLAKVNNADIKAFSIDRITSLTVKEITKNNELKQADFTDYYKNVFGIVKPDGIEKPTTIIISFERTLGEMLESRPLHPTQKVVSRSENELIMEYSILYKPITNDIIMRDLHRELCKYAGSIRIIEPVELRDEIVKLLEKGIDMNKEKGLTLALKI